MPVQDVKIFALFHQALNLCGLCENLLLVLASDGLFQHGIHESDYDHHGRAFEYDQDP